MLSAIHTKMSFLRKNKDFLIYGVGQAFNLLSPLLIAPYIFLKCHDAGFGKVGLGFAFALFSILIVDYSFDVKGTKEVSENRDNPDKLQSILNTAVFTKITLFFFVLLIAVFVISYIPFFNSEKNLFFFSLLIVFAQVFNPAWFLQGIENFKLFSYLNVFSKTTYVILVFVFISQSEDYVYVNLLLGISNLVFYLTGLFIIKRKHQFKIIVPRAAEVLGIIKNDFFFCVSQLLLSVRQLSPLFFTVFFLGYNSAGLYKIIEQIITLYRTFIQVFLKFFYPKFCYKYALDNLEGFHFWKKYSLLNLGLVVVSLLLIFFNADFILQYFNLSEKLIQTILPVFKVSLLVSLLMSISLPLEQLIFVLKKHTAYIKITFAVTSINLLLLFLLINRFDLFGIVASLIIAELLFITLYYINTMKLK